MKKGKLIFMKLHHETTFIRTLSKMAASLLSETVDASRPRCGVDQEIWARAESQVIGLVRNQTESVDGFARNMHIGWLIFKKNEI
ncbi:MAG: hypothetical protein GY737_30515 [Desulfobacteraceae bacterium]|nr:hypothetical protein [Desulfobacteraceae bacterium]